MQPSFAIITPSFFGDLERCQLLVRSVKKYAPKWIKHYLIVPKRDAELFNHLVSDQVEMIFEDDFMPSWLFPIPFLRKWSFSLKSPPVRGWIRQQVLKLSAVKATKADILIFMDSDCFFTRPFDPSQLLNDQGKAPLFRETTEHDSQYAAWYQCGQKN